MLRCLIVIALLTLPFGLGCSGNSAAPTSVSEDEKQKLIEAEKQVEMEERAQMQSTK